MPLGPIELLVVKFPGNQFRGEIAPALADLVDAGTIRIIDILFATKDEDGKLSVAEINDLDDAEYATFDPVVSDITGLLTPEDVEQLTASLEPNSSAGLMLFENTWAKAFADAVVNAHGEVIISERIPRAVVEEMVAAADTQLE
jgi:Family of unknown function (DUF6325)